MKNITKVLFLISLFVYLSSCQKSLFNEEETNPHVPAKSLPASLPSEYDLIPSLEVGAAIESEVVRFDNQYTFDNTLNNLRNETQAWEDQFYSYAETVNLTEEELYNMLDGAGLTLNEVYEEWESNLGFVSLRKTIESQIDIWLNSATLDTINDPDEYFIYDDALRAITNSDNQFAIGDFIYQVLPNWDVLVFEVDDEGNGGLPGFKEFDKSFKAGVKFLKKIKDYSKDEFKKLEKEGKIKYYENNSGSDQKYTSYRTQKFNRAWGYFVDNSTTLAMKVRGGVRNIPLIAHYVKAKGKVFKLTTNVFGSSCWRRAYYKQSCSTTGTVYDNAETPYSAAANSTQGTNKRHWVSAKRSYSGTIKIKSNCFGFNYYVTGKNETFYVGTVITF